MGDFSGICLSAAFCAAALCFRYCSGVGKDMGGSIFRCCIFISCMGQAFWLTGKGIARAGRSTALCSGLVQSAAAVSGLPPFLLPIPPSASPVLILWAYTGDRSAFGGGGSVCGVLPKRRFPLQAAGSADSSGPAGNDPVCERVSGMRKRGPLFRYFPGKAESIVRACQKYLLCLHGGICL